MRYLVLLLVLASPAQGQIVIKSSEFVGNRRGGFCAWACLDMLARHHKIEPLIGITDHYFKHSPADGGATIDQVVSQCRTLEVKHAWQGMGDFDLKLIERARKDKLGCIVGLRHWGRQGGDHAVVLYDYDDDYVYLVDPNERLENLRMDWVQFKSRWRGAVLLIER